MKAKSNWIFKLFKALAIVGVAVGSFGFVALQVVSDPHTRASHDQTGVRSIFAKASAYILDTGQAPKSLEDLLSNARQLKGWKGPYLTEFQARNPWGHHYLIQSPGLHSELDVISLGADGLVGGVDANADIGTWQ